MKEIKSTLDTICGGMFFERSFSYCASSWNNTESVQYLGDKKFKFRGNKTVYQLDEQNPLYIFAEEYGPGHLSVTFTKSFFTEGVLVQGLTGTEQMYLTKIY